MKTPLGVRADYAVAMLSENRSIAVRDDENFFEVSGVIVKCRFRNVPKPLGISLISTQGRRFEFLDPSFQEPSGCC